MRGRVGRGSGWRGGVRVDVNEELKLLLKLKKNGRGSGWWGGVRSGLVGGQVDVNAMLGGGGDVGYVGCKPRIEGIEQCTKSYCTILRKLKKMWGEGEGQYLNQNHSQCT